MVCAWPPPPPRCIILIPTVLQDRTGGVDPKHAAAYAGFGAWIRSCYGSPVGTGSLAPGATSIEVTLSKATAIDRVRMEEDQTKGQLIISCEHTAHHTTPQRSASAVQHDAAAWSYGL
jgi:hypothetical protein